MTIASKPYRVVVAVDFTETSLPAFVQALRLVQSRPGSELHAVHVLFKSLAGPDGMAEDDARLDDAYRRLRDFVLQHGSATQRSADQAVWYHARIGDAAESIHQVAVDVDADVIVVGTADKRGVERILLGSVAEKLVRIARVPVLVARKKNFDGLAKSPTPEPGRAGEDLHRQRGDMVRSSELVAFDLVPTSSHIAGLI